MTNTQFCSATARPASVNAGGVIPGEPDGVPDPEPDPVPDPEPDPVPDPESDRGPAL
jgi:hypothetical protein